MNIKIYHPRYKQITFYLMKQVFFALPRIRVGGGDRTMRTRWGAEISIHSGGSNARKTWALRLQEGAGYAWLGGGQENHLHRASRKSLSAIGWSLPGVEENAFCWSGPYRYQKRNTEIGVADDQGFQAEAQHTTLQPTR